MASKRNRAFDDAHNPRLGDLANTASDGAVDAIVSAPVTARTYSPSRYLAVPDGEPDPRATVSDPVSARAQQV